MIPEPIDEDEGVGSFAPLATHPEEFRARITDISKRAQDEMLKRQEQHWARKVMNTSPPPPPPSRRYEGLMKEAERYTGEVSGIRPHFVAAWKEAVTEVKNGIVREERLKPGAVVQSEDGTPLGVLTENGLVRMAGTVELKLAANPISWTSDRVELDPPMPWKTSEPVTFAPRGEVVAVVTPVTPPPEVAHCCREGCTEPIYITTHFDGSLCEEHAKEYGESRYADEAKRLRRWWKPWTWFRRTVKP